MPNPDLRAEQQTPVPNDLSPVQSMVRTDMQARAVLARERFGTPLQAYYDRDALRDAYEEALDLACYLKMAIQERPREDVTAAVAAVRSELESTIRRQADLIGELRRQYAIAEQVRDHHITKARRVPRLESALRAALEALLAAPRTCRFHGTDFGETVFGEPRCESCRLPFKVAVALLNCRAELGEPTGAQPGGMS